ncbi:MAG: DUF1629 domain-containing protein [Pseudomonadota bacterium]
MAATIEVRLENRFSRTRLAMFSQDRKELKEQREAFIDARRFELMRADPTRVNPKYGHLLPEALFPKDLICTCGHKMYDYVDAPLGPIVSAAFRDCVEAIEPGVHRFLPVEIFKTDKTPHEQSPFFYFDIRNFLDAIDPSTGAVETIGRDSFDNPHRTWSIVSNRHSDLAVKKERVDGKAAWIDLRLPRTFFSDALIEQLEAVGLEGHRLQDKFAEI